MDKPKPESKRLPEPMEKTLQLIAESVSLLNEAATAKQRKIIMKRLLKSIVVEQ